MGTWEKSKGKAQRQDGDQLYQAECFHRDHVGSTQINLFQPLGLQLPFASFQVLGKDFTEKQLTLIFEAKGRQRMILL